MTAPLIFGIAVLALVAWVAAPVLREGVWRGGDLPEVDPDELARKRDTALVGLRDLELDHEMGKVEEDDYQRVKQEYEREAVEAMDALEGTDRKDTTTEPNRREE